MKEKTKTKYARLLEEMKRVEVDEVIQENVANANATANDETSENKRMKMGVDYEVSDEEEVDAPLSQEVEETKTPKEELAAYRSMSQADYGTDVLGWWRKRKSQFPRLVFSSLGNLLTKKRLAMTGAHVNQQLFLRNKLQ